MSIDFRHYVAIQNGDRLLYVTSVDEKTGEVKTEFGKPALVMTDFSSAKALVFNLRKNVDCDAVVLTRMDKEIPFNEWFGHVRWCDEDIAGAIEEQGYEATPEAIALIRAECEHHCFTDGMIETGNHYIHSYVMEHASELAEASEEDDE